jgi:hypothetical protein
MEGDLYKYPIKIYHRRQSSCSRGDSIKGIVRAFSWLKCLGGFLHLKPTVGCQISTLIFEFSFVEGCLYEYPITNILRTAKFLSTGGFNQRYCPDLYLTEVPGWVSAPQANSRVSNINFDIWFFWRCGLYKYPAIFIVTSTPQKKIQISKLIFDTLLSAWGAETHKGTSVS